MKTSENAPRTRGSAASALSATLALRGSANSAVSTSVSEVPTGPRHWSAAPSTIAASSSVLMRLPLWPSARLPDAVERKVGWAFSQTEAPLVEYRQWPTAMWPRNVDRTDSSKTWATRPMSLYTTIRAPSLTAMPADSCPRCCSA
jgi:hypothetical protein